jgi:hypothetical protein
MKVNLSWSKARKMVSSMMKSKQADVHQAVIRIRTSKGATVVESTDETPVKERYVKNAKTMQCIN